MVKIEQRKLNNCELFINEYSSIYFSCIINGLAEGIVWGDEKENPKFLLVWSPYQEGFQLMGKPIQEEDYGIFREWFITTIIPFLHSVKLDYFEFGTDTNELLEMFKAIFKELNIMSADQKIFRWTAVKDAVTIPPEYQVKKVDRDFFRNNYIDENYIREEIVKACGSLECFFERGVAYVCIKSNEVVARADMLFGFQGYGNISVDTKEAHRKKGISSYLVMKVIEDTRNMGLIPIWDCTDDNIASEKTAIKCGFSHTRNDVISWFTLQE